MSRKFEVGDRVRIVSDVAPEMRGREATVIGLWVGSLVGCEWHGRVPEGTEFCRLDIPSKRGRSEWVGYPHDHLEPVYDGNQAASWSDCAWSPRDLRVRA